MPLDKLITTIALGTAALTNTIFHSMNGESAVGTSTYVLLGLFAGSLISDTTRYVYKKYKTD